MRLLLDTHALLWWLSDDAKLGERAREVVADPRNEVLVSVVCIWEILVKVSAGKLEADVRAILDEVIAEGFSLLELGPTHLMAVAALPVHHKDPFDQMIIAQAIASDAILLSEDSHVGSYPVRRITCSGKDMA